MKNFKYRFFLKIFIFSFLIIFIYWMGIAANPMCISAETGTDTGTIEITKSGLLRGDRAKLSLYFMDGSTKTYVSPSPQEVGDGEKVSWTGLIPGKTYYVEEDFHKIENIYTYDITNPVAEIPLDSTAKVERTVQNNPDITSEMPAGGEVQNEDGDNAQGTLKGEAVTDKPVPGETYLLIHGSTILESTVINLGENTATSDFAWYMLLTIKDKAISSESGYVLNPTIFGPATFNPIATRISFSLRDTNSDSSNEPSASLSLAANTGITQLPGSFEMDSIMLISALSAFIGLLAVLIAPIRRRQYRRWKHAYGNEY